jgi:hypothetical protein
MVVTYEVLDARAIDDELVLVEVGVSVRTRGKEGPAS